jgi:hypothetical protein
MMIWSSPHPDLTGLWLIIKATINASSLKLSSVVRVDPAIHQVSYNSFSLSELSV